MKNNKLLETIMILDTLERKRFRNVIKNKKRNSLFSLYELCLSRIEKELPLPEKEEVYAYLFNENYTKENDFLLRNEYRLLTDEAEDFIRKTAVEVEFPGVCEAARLRKILDAGNMSLFKKEFDVLSEKYKDDLMFWLVIDPKNLYHFIISQQISAEHFDEIKNLITKAQDRLGRLYNRVLSDYEVKRGYADKIHSILSDNTIVPIPTATVKTLEKDHLVEYRKLKAQSYYVSGTEKINVLLAAEKILKENLIPELGIDETWWLKANAGLEYYLQKDVKNAIVYFDALFALPEIETFNRLPEAALNYQSALMSVGDYEKAIKMISPFEERMASAPPVFYKYICLKSLGLLFLNKPPQARKELNRVEHHAVEFDFMYWRIAMVLSFTTEKRWDDAQNEFKNLQKTKTVKNNIRPDFDNMIFVLDSFIKIAIAKQDGKKIKASAWTECEQRIQTMLNSPGDFVHPPRLIEKQLKELQTS